MRSTNRIALALILLSGIWGTGGTPALVPDIVITGLLLALTLPLLLPAALRPWTPGRWSDVPRGRRRTLILVALPLGALLAFTSDAPIRWLLLPAALTGLRSPRPTRTFRIVRDVVVLLAAEVLRGGAVEAVGALVVAVVAAASVLPGILDHRSRRRLRRLSDVMPPPSPRPRTWTAPATAAMALLLFLLLPRPGLGSGLEPMEAGGRSTASSGRRDGSSSPGGGAVPMRSISIGDIGRLQTSHRPLIEAVFVRNGIPAPADDLGPLLRSGPLDTFDGFAWTAPGDRGHLMRDGDDGSVDGTLHLPVRALPRPPEGESLETRLHLLVGGTDSLFCPGIPVAATMPTAEDALVVLSRGDLRTAESYVDGTRWTLRSIVGRGAYPLLDATPPDPSRIENLLQVPPGHERTVALADEYLAGMRPGRRLLHFLERLLAERCTYSLDIADPDGEMPVESFLFRSRRGHCELFASSAVVMLRARGIPARIAVGFRGGMADPESLKYTFRGADAHAWVEAWLPGTGWVTFDPTPSADGEPSPISAAEGEEFEDAVVMERNWLRRMMEYDGASQAALLKSAGRGLGNLLAAVVETVHRSPLRAGLLVLLLATLLVLGRRTRSRAGLAAGPREPTAQPGPLPGSWQRLTGILAEAGLRRGSTETPAEFAQRALRRGAGPAEAVLAITRSYAAQRWGSHLPPDDEARRLDSLAASVAVAAASAPRV